MNAADVDELVADAVKTVVARKRGRYPTFREIVKESGVASLLVQEALDRLQVNSIRIVDSVVWRNARLRHPSAARRSVVVEQAFVEFWAVGDPAPQGSKSYKGTRNDGTPILVESSLGLPRWRADVTAAAAVAAAKAGVRFPEGPVEVEILFTLRRPERPRWPQPATRRNDIDKLVRAVLDALTMSQLIGDDGQVTDLQATKQYAEEKDQACGAVVIVTGQYGVRTG